LLQGFYKVRFRPDEAAGRSVMYAHAGRMLGGNSSFAHIGTSENGRWKGQMLNQEHTSAVGEYPIFGGHEVGIGFSGSGDDQSARLEATALAGKRSLRLTAELKLVRRTQEANPHG
jgi:hypothetical protein